MDKETLEKLMLHNIVQLFVSGDAKCLNENTDTFTFHHFQILILNLNKKLQIKSPGFIFSDIFYFSMGIDFDLGLMI